MATVLLPNPASTLAGARGEDDPARAEDIEPNNAHRHVAWGMSSPRPWPDEKPRLSASDRPQAWVMESGSTTARTPTARPPPPMARHAYSFAIDSRQPGGTTHDIMVASVERVGGLAICRMGLGKLSDPVAISSARSYSRRNVPEGMPLELSSQSLLLSPRGRMALRDLELTKYSPSAAEMEGSCILAQERVRPPEGRPTYRTAPPALTKFKLNAYGVYERPPANHAIRPPCDSPRSLASSSAARERRKVEWQIRSGYVTPPQPWVARRAANGGSTNFELYVQRCAERRAAPGAKPRPPRHARGPSAPPLIMGQESVIQCVRRPLSAADRAVRYR